MPKFSWTAAMSAGVVAGVISIDHAIGEGDVLGDPVLERWIAESGEGEEDTLRDVTVALQVVAGHDGEGRECAFVAAAQCFGDEAD